MAARFFDVPDRGSEREAMLETFRVGLRQLIDPETGDYVTEAKVALATQELSRWWSEYDAVDISLLAVHAKAAALADQIAPSRSTTGTLRGLHAPLRGVAPLKAVGATLICEAEAGAGSTFFGSTTIPDPAAAFATNNAGLKFQVLLDVVTPPSGIATLTLVGIDTGERTNLEAGTKLRWAGNQPLSAVQEFIVTVDGSGGIGDETDADLASRIEADISHPPASGNNAHNRRWAREASVAVEDAFVYPCAKYAGTDVVCVTQKRGRQTEAAPKGPLARIASAGTVAIVRAYLTPPGSPVKPERIVSFVVTPTPVYSNMSIGLSLPRGRGLGWADTRPFPTYEAAPATVSAVSSQTEWTIETDAELPASGTPKIMIWARELSRWEKLTVTSITAAGVGFYDVVLAATPTHTVAVGDYISPLVTGYVLMGQAVERYFDSRGPGEVVDLDTDPRAPRARRFPDPVERYPQIVGSTIITTLQNALPGTIGAGEGLEVSVTSPALPDDPADGPLMIVAGHVGVYPSD